MWLRVYRDGMDFQLPEDDDPRRLTIRAWIAEHPAPTGRELAEAGYVVPHWPKPWGIDADPIHQLIIDDELDRAGIRRPINPIGMETLKAWEELCRLFDLPESSRRIHLKNHLRLREDAIESAELLASSWKTTTALIVFPPPDCNLQLLQEQLIQKGRAIPESLALIFIVPPVVVV